MPRRLQLKPGREIPILRGHPWVMSGAVARDEGDRQEDEADVVAATGAFLGRATVHPRSEILARVYGADPADRLDAAGIRARLAAAVERRRRWTRAPADGAERLVFSESDGLPGLIVDRYAAVLAVQFLTAPWEPRREAVISALREWLQPRTIWERSDVDARRAEGVEPRKGLLWGEPLAGPVEFQEAGCRFLADVEAGHKTGFYLDQRENRGRVADWIRRLGRPAVLNVFAYTDTFGVCAMRAEAASVLALDSSSAAAETAARHYELNPPPAGFAREFRAVDAFQELRNLRQAGAQFDCVIVDPPRLVARRDRMKEGLRAYKDANRLALELLRPGGILATFSCSGLVDRELFGKVIEGAARDAHRAVQVLDALGQPPDHPRKLGFPESEYLKGLILGA
jgi:23S rRNA (cytosine1962-C5)-methyltransferase